MLIREEPAAASPTQPLRPVGCHPAERFALECGSVGTGDMQAAEDRLAR